ncbi:MAG: hypothetical protein N838_29935 [Thiohalocapsa sp. PB-PSB1]|nr:MAG: hypothetical protein N838_29935 [Thiohalocapsa sp. PB-PSB1]
MPNSSAIAKALARPFKRLRLAVLDWHSFIGMGGRPFMCGLCLGSVQKQAVQTPVRGTFGLTVSGLRLHHLFLNLDLGQR